MDLRTPLIPYLIYLSPHYHFIIIVLRRRLKTTTKNELLYFYYSRRRQKIDNMRVVKYFNDEF